MRRRFGRDVQSLPLVFAFVREFFAAVGVDEANCFAADLMLEELVTNSIKYNAQSREEVEIVLERSGDELIIRVIDRDTEPFDPTLAPEPDTSRPLEERTPGGLGLHLVRRIADGIEYLYENRTATTTLRKRLEPENV